MNIFRTRSLVIAEVLDAYRLVPRILVGAYGLLVYGLYTWYRSLETFTQMSCDNRLIEILIANGMDVERAMATACTVVAVVGGPTAQQTVFVTGIIGLATGVFGFYVTSGRKWGTAESPYTSYSPTEKPKI